MTFLPVVQRELQIAARRPATYRLRFFATLVALVCHFWLLLTGQGYVSPLRLGVVLFNVLGTLLFLFCLLVGAFVTADCLSEERREGTLGLLFLTPLRGYDVVLGKLLATSLRSFYGLLAVLPVLGLCLLMGSVAPAEFGRVALALVDILFLSLAVGMLVSACCLDTRQSVTATLLALVGLGFAHPLVMMALRVWNPPGAVWRWAENLLLLSPANLFGNAMAVTAGNAPRYWAALGAQLALGLGALAFTAWRLPRAWTLPARAAAKGSLAAWFRRLRFGRATFGSRGDALAENPYHWLAARDRLPAWAGSGVLGLLFCLWLVFVVGTRLTRGVASSQCVLGMMVTGFALHLCLKYLVAAEAARRLNEDHRSGALEMLLVTPLSVTQILDGHRRALQGMFTGPLLLALLWNLGMFVWTMEQRGNSPNHIGGEGLILMLEIIIGSAVVLVADLGALTWVGMWMGLKRGRHTQAIYAALGLVLGLPWLALVLLFGIAFRGLRDSDAIVLLALWLGLGLILDGVLVGRTRARLRQALRPAGAGREGSPEAAAWYPAGTVKPTAPTSAP